MTTTEEDPDKLLPEENEVIKNRREHYKIVKLLGKGGYGAVYEVVRLSDDKKFAIKCEKHNARKKVLMMDCCVLRGAQQIKSRHFCTIADRGKVNDRFAFLVMQLIGKNLWDLRVERDSMRFTMGTSLKAAIQCLICIEELHRIGFLHRDIKPGNFAVGLDQQQLIYMLDFGLSRQFAKTEAKQDVRKQRNNAPFRGTTRYAPLAAMKEEDQSRKDDIEGWLYMVVEWTAGQLPWRKFNADNRDEVMVMKTDLRNPNGQALDVFLTDCPKREFARILKYVDELNYFSIPDYKFVYECVIHAMKSNNVKWSEPLDWDEKNDYTAPVEIPGDGRLIVLEVAENDEENKIITSREKAVCKDTSKEKNGSNRKLLTASKEKTSARGPSARSKIKA